MSNSPLWTHLSALPDTFEDVLIVDLDPSKTTWSKIHEDLRVVYLKLNREPPDLLWTKFFHQERESRTMIRRRGLWIEDGYISFDCLPEEIEPFHLPDIQRSVDFANRKYREYFDMRRREMRASDPIESARGTLEQMRSRLFTPLDQPTEPAPKPQNARLAPSVDPLKPVNEAPVELELPAEIIAAHESAIAAARESVQTHESNAIVKRADQYRADVLPSVPFQRQAATPEPVAPPAARSTETALPPVESKPNLDAWRAETAKLGAAPPATPKSVSKNDQVTEQTLEQTLAEYRAKVRAAFDAQKKKT